jgi:hypothetical protein
MAYRNEDSLIENRTNAITQVDLNRAVLRRWNSESVVAVGFTDADASIGQLHRQYLQ